jgi:hypothetical protein
LAVSHKGSASPFIRAVPSDFPQINKVWSAHEKIRRPYRSFHSPKQTPPPLRSFAVCAISAQALSSPRRQRWDQ